MTPSLTIKWKPRESEALGENCIVRVASRSERISQWQCSTPGLAIGWFFRFCFRFHQPSQPWTYCLGNFPHAPVQCWRYQRNQCTRIFTPTLKRGEGGFFPTFETKIVAWPPLTNTMEKHCVLLVNRCLVGEVSLYYGLLQVSYATQPDWQSTRF